MSLLPDGYVFQPNRTQQWLADHYRSAQRDSALVCTKLEFTPPKPSDWQRLRAMLDRNGLASVVFESHSDLLPFQQRRCLGDTELAATATLLGLRAHRRDHAELADSLEQLVPTYLASLPRDGFDGEPLRYSKTDRRLHSIGSDGTDRGGEDDPSSRRNRDQFEREPTYFVRF